MAARPRIYDAEELAINMVETFKDRPYEYSEDFPFEWPTELQNVGDSLAVAYASDKWKPKDERGRRQWELFKHLAESRNRALVRKNLLKHQYAPGKNWPVRGPMVSLADAPMPEHVAILGLFEEIDLALYTCGKKRQLGFSPNPDEGIVKAKVRHGFLGASYIRWSAIGRGKDQPFLFVYTRSQGVLMMVIGDELDVEKDGIVG